MNNSCLRAASFAVLVVLMPAWIAAAPPAKEKRGSGPAAEQELFRIWDFDRSPVGSQPEGFAAYRSGAAQTAAIWMVERDETAPSPPHILRQSAPCSDEACLQILLAETLVYDYPDVSIRMRLLPGLSGGSTSAAGLVFGARDRNNLYAALVDTTGAQLEVVRVRDGVPTVLSRATVKPKKVVWHHLRVQRNTIISKEYIEVFYDGELTLSFEDKTLEPGQIGLVTRGDSIVSFDHLHAAPLYSQKPLSPPAAY